MWGFEFIAQERACYRKALAEAEARQKNFCDTFVDTDYAQDARDRIVARCNELVRERGVKRGMRACEKALGMRSTGLIFDPNSFGSPVLKMWHKDIAFHGFTRIVRDETPLWALEFTCDYTWTEGSGRERRRRSRTLERTIHFERPIEEDMDVEALFAGV